jgi:DNA repair exonuclease SbcCD ATPase subunit
VRWSNLSIQNFLSITKAEIKLDDRGLVLIEGVNLTSNKFKSNGAGKTSLLEALPYAIYDTTSKGLSADDVINNKVGKNTAVILEGHKGDDVYRIERYRKHTKNKNKVKLFCNDKEITGKSAKETNSMIEQIVGTDYNTFINSIMFSQGSGAGRFALATDKEKKEILEGLVNMGIYAKAQDIAKDRVKAKDAEIMEKKREGERLNWELTQVDTLEQQDVQSYENTKNLIKQEQQNIGKIIEEMDYYVRHNFSPTETLREEIPQLEQQRERMVNVNLQSYMNDMNAAGGLVSNNQFKQDELNRDKARLVADYQKLQSSTNCPVCGNLLDPIHREQEMTNIKEQLRQVLVQLQPLTQELPELEAKYQEEAAKFQKIKESHDNINNEYRDLTNTINNKKNEILTYERTLQGYKDKVENTKRTIETLGKIPQPQKRDKERQSIREKLKAQKEQLLALEKEKTQLENVVKVFSNTGVKSHVLDLITPFLNERGNQYLATLSGPEMELKFDTQTDKKDGTKSDKFDLKVYNKAGGDDYKAQSEGEKKRADLSVALALQDLVMSRADSATNFVVYDEVFDALDEIGCENVVTLLKERQKQVGTIFVITHSAHLKPLFEQTITVVKDKNGESTIREGEVTT